MTEGERNEAGKIEGFVRAPERPDVFVPVELLDALLEGLEQRDSFVSRNGQAPLLPAGLAAIVAAATAPAATTAAAEATAAAAAETATTAPIRFGPRLVHGEIAAAQRILVELLNRLLRILVGGHLHEREAARAARHLIAHDGDRLDLTGLSEEILQILLAGAEREIAHKKFPSHSSNTPAPHKSGDS